MAVFGQTVACGQSRSANTPEKKGHLYGKGIAY
jgi:hypothetical protein